MLSILISALTFVATDTIDARSLTRAPQLDGRVDAAEYGEPSLRIRTTSGDVTTWIARHGGYVYIAAVLPDSTFYWGDDFVVSVDPDGSGGQNPGDGDRQWSVRRVLDSSVVLTAANGRWMTPGQPTPMLGATRHADTWSIASSSAGTQWTVELRIRESVLTAPRIAFRTYNDSPGGWWSSPAPAEGVPAQRVERSPDAWAVLRLR